ncbi:MAG: hypothetical protein CMG50_05710 [Candidatus Marinimicrobia bacterium]|nr:hypothetical protein [Candidatus Neomarinimicrobiota bacterium]|tara:strand:+ start:51 stop:560 length:510 start_codon:yes stop_codon:yes gene_type:complete
MKRITIISATKGQNYILSKNIKSLLKDKNLYVELEDLEKYDIPLFTASNYTDIKLNVGKKILSLVNKLIDCDGIIICAPEYNGCIPPILVNMISWVSVSTPNWRDGFINKISLIASNSGGAAIKYNIAMKNQLEHLGSVVYPRFICVNDNNPLDSVSVKKILKDFINLL